jgi:arylsulfatase A-like enzyme
MKFITFALLVLLGLGCQPDGSNDKVAKKYLKTYGEMEVSDKILNDINYLLITSDQQHWMAMGYNDSTISTPNLDRLAENGIIFDRAYCPNPTCTPTRASIITGMMPSQHGAYVLGTKLPETVHTVGEDFAAHGYETTLIGKAHFQPFRGNAEFPSLEAYPILQDLDFWEEFHGPFYGFNHVELARNHGDEAHVGQHYVLWMEEKLKAEGKDPESWKAWFRTPTGDSESQYGLWNMPEEYHMNTWISERTNHLLQEYKNSNKSFFIWASFFDPHPPYLVPGSWANMYDPEDMNLPVLKPGELDDMPPIYQKTQEKTPDFSEFKDNDMWSAGIHSHVNRSLALRKKDMALYYGMVSFMDQEIGKILDKLDALDLTRNTLVVFTSDHGNLFGQHGLIKKGPFMYEDLVKVPFVASCPELMPSGIRSQSLLSLIDLAPTFLSFAGIDIPRSMTGLDQKDVWTGKKESIRTHVIVENHQQAQSLYQKQLVTDRYKITVYMNHPYGELFDLKNDPNELNNLWNSPEYSALKNTLILELLQSDMKQEAIVVERTAGA